jgi:Mu transposase-like protein
MNAHVMRRLGLSRSDLFASVERPALRALPASDYEFAEWRLSRVGLDYHVEIEGFYYSVPHALIRAQVDVCITSRTIEVFHHAKRIAAHQRRYGGPRHGTDPDHMPSAHRRYAAWSPERFQRWARNRPEHRRPGDRRARQPSASRAGLSHLPRRAAPVSRACPGPRRGRCGSRRRHRGAHLQERRFHSQKQSRSRFTSR